MSSERQRLRPWLEEQVESGDVPGLRWMDKEKTTFRVTWKHAGKPDFNLDQDAVLFRKWAEHTGKYKPGEQPDPSTWKTRFRCALHKMPDIEEIRVPHSLDENEPYRVFRLKPKALSSPKQRKTSSITSYSTACPSPPPNDFNPFSYPHGSYPSYNSLICPQKNTGPMAGNVPDMMAFPSPISSHNSSPANSADFNIFDDIDRITPTIPPIPPFSFAFDQSMDHMGLKPQQPIPYTALNDDFIFKNNFINTLSNAHGFYNTNTENPYEPTLTELQSVSRSEQMGYAGGGTSLPNDGGLTYNNMPSYNTCQNFLYPGQNGTNPSHQMGLLKMLHGGSPTEMVHEINLAPVTSGFNMGSNPMDISAKGNYCTATRTEVQPISNHSIMTHRAAQDTKHANQITEWLLSCRVYYSNKEVSSFEINNTERMWRIFYGNPVKPDDETGLNQLYGPYKAKQILLPDSSSSEDVQHVLDNFYKGLVLEMTDEGILWATKICQSKVYLSRGPQDVTRLVRDVRTNVIDFRQAQNSSQENPQHNIFESTRDCMLSIGEDPTIALIKLVFTPLKAKKMKTENQTKSFAD